MPRVVKEDKPEVSRKTIVRDVNEVIIGVPLGELGNGYLSRHVEARLTVKQATAMQMVTLGLRDRRAVMSDGKEVRTQADALKWMLESVVRESSGSE